MPGLKPLAALIAAMLVAGAGPARPDPVIGTWSNPKGTVVVRTAHCGNAICGKVVRASPSAEEAARAAGTSRLVGTQILTGFRAVGAGRWQGEAFIADRGVTVIATMVQLGPDALEIEGCGLGGYLCKRQLWRRTPPTRARRPG